MVQFFLYSHYLCVLENLLLNNFQYAGFSSWALMQSSTGTYSSKVLELCGSSLLCEIQLHLGLVFTAVLPVKKVCFILYYCVALCH